MTDTADCVFSQETRLILAEVFQNLTGMPELQCDCGPDTGEFEYTFGDYEDGYSVAVRPRHHESCPVIEEERRQMSETIERVGKVIRRACVTNVTGVASVGLWRRTSVTLPT
ncbi:MAG: hypothetical protein ACXVGI_10415 [Mycobacteriaceae bacterium]